MLSVDVCSLCCSIPCCLSYCTDEENGKAKFIMEDKELKDLIWFEEKEIEVSFLLFILAGLKESGKTELLQHFFNKLVTNR